jgi:hypothetical protein
MFPFPVKVHFKNEENERNEESAVDVKTRMNFDRKEEHFFAHRFKDSVPELCEQESFFTLPVVFTFSVRKKKAGAPFSIRNGKTLNVIQKMMRRAA